MVVYTHNLTVIISFWKDCITISICSFICIYITRIFFMADTINLFLSDITLCFTLIECLSETTCACGTCYCVDYFDARWIYTWPGNDIEQILRRSGNTEFIPVSNYIKNNLKWCFEPSSSISMMFRGIKNLLCRWTLEWLSVN